MVLFWQCRRCSGGCFGQLVLAIRCDAASLCSVGRTGLWGETLPCRVSPRRLSYLALVLAPPLRSAFILGVSPPAGGDQGLWSRLPARSVLLHPKGTSFGRLRQRCPLDIRTPWIPATFEKVDETFVVWGFGGFSLRQYSVCSPRSKSPAAGKFFPDLTEAPEGSALGVRPKGATTRNRPVRSRTAKSSRAVTHQSGILSIFV